MEKPQLESLQCPHCRNPLRTADRLACDACGRQYALGDQVLSFIDTQASLLADQEMARRLLDNFPDAEAAISAAQLADAEKRRKGLAELARLLGVSTDTAYRKMLDDTLPLAQVINDLRYFRDPATYTGTSVTHQFMSNTVRNFEGAAILDVGCSVGRHLRRLSPASNKLTGIDISALSLCLAAQSWASGKLGPLPLLCGASVTEMPFADEHFDQVMSFVVLGLVPMKRALCEIRRVLKPGGELVFTIEGVGFWQKLWDAAPLLSRTRLGLARRWLARQFLLVNLQCRRLSTVIEYSPRGIRNLLSHSGFEVSRLEVLSQYRNKPLSIGVVARKPS